MSIHNTFSIKKKMSFLRPKIAKCCTSMLRINALCISCSKQNLCLLFILRALFTQKMRERRGKPLYILRGTRNLSFLLRRSLLRTFETIWILVITLECSNITASKSIRRERKMRPMELSRVNFSTHVSESECSCFDQALCIRVC